MTEYDGVAFLDLDGLVVGNMDTAFDILAVGKVSLASVADEGTGYDGARAAPQAGCKRAANPAQANIEMTITDA